MFCTRDGISKKDKANKLINKKMVIKNIKGFPFIREKLINYLKYKYNIFLNIDSFF